MLFVVAVLVSVSATANLLGTYMIRPVVNNLADGKVSTLIAGVAIATVILELVRFLPGAIPRQWLK